MTLCELLKTSRNIVVVGISDKPYRDSGIIAELLVKNGFNVVGVHPTLQKVNGIEVYSQLSEVPFSIDILDVFLSGEKLVPLIPEILALHPKCIWLQLGVFCQELESAAVANGIFLVTGRCIAVELRNCD